MEIETLHRISEYLIDHRKTLLDEDEDIAEINDLLEELQSEIENEG